LTFGIWGNFACFGVDPSRIDMEAFVPSVFDHLSQYGLVDLALDTFRYNGTTTTFEVEITLFLVKNTRV